MSEISIAESNISTALENLVTLFQGLTEWDQQDSVQEDRDKVGVLQLGIRNWGPPDHWYTHFHGIPARLLIDMKIELPKIVESLQEVSSIGYSGVDHKIVLFEKDGSNLELALGSIISRNHSVTELYEALFGLPKSQKAVPDGP